MEPEVGTVKSIIEDRGFGFIRRATGLKDVFFHISELDPSIDFDETLIERRVTYTIVTTPRGEQANAVRPAE